MTAIVATLIDNSGSMRGAIWRATMVGFNKFLEYQQMRNDDCEGYLAFYNDYLHVIEGFKPIFQLPKQPIDTDMTRGGTRMWGSIVGFLGEVKTRADATSAESVVCLIQTDGEDNSMAARKDAQDIVKARVKDGWEFLWFAACDVQELAKGDRAGPVQAGLKLGLPRSRIIPYAAAKGDKVFDEVGLRILEATVTGHWDELDKLAAK